MDRHRMAKRSDDVASKDVCSLATWVGCHLLASVYSKQDREQTQRVEHRRHRWPTVLLASDLAEGQKGLVAVRAEMDGVAEAGMPPLARCCGSDRGGAGGGAR